MRQINIQYFETNYGELILGAFNDKLCLCDWRYRTRRTTVDNRISKGLNASYIEQDDQVLKQTRQQLEEYFAGARQHFDIPLETVGTNFQRMVWSKLLEIPYGETSSYLKLAESIGNVKAIRAAANANGANALSIFIPCHRIIGSDGKLVGYAGGMEAKERLLKLEAR
ncbi:methylated-DNA--[protein]-cysteine S-methyltransferase [Alteromonadaceae bacterium M269]|nr:methylated-DNA--[protein]-cysteine S-methyltransferase [Alteromonadaceae bacterium M269]